MTRFASIPLHVATFALVILLATTTLPAANAAQDTSGLRIAAHSTPDSVFRAPMPFAMGFVNLAALRQLHDGNLPVATMKRLALPVNIRPLKALRMAVGHDDIATWQDKAGVSLGQPRFVAGMGMAPHDVSIWGFANEGAATKAFDGLKALGFTPVEGASGMLANGKPGGMNLDAGDPINPWLGMEGRTSVVVRNGATLLQAPGPRILTVIQSMQGKQKTMADSPIGQALLTGLSDGDGTIIQAMMFGPIYGLTAGDPAKILLHTHSREERIKALKQAMSKQITGVPLYRGAALADIQTDAGPVLVVALAYPNCEFADQAGATMTKLWPQIADGEAQSKAVASHIDAGDAGCTAVMRIVSNDAATNKPLHQIVLKMMQRRPTLIRIGTP